MDDFKHCFTKTYSYFYTQIDYNKVYIPNKNVFKSKEMES